MGTPDWQDEKFKSWAAVVILSVMASVALALGVIVFWLLLHNA